MPPVRPLRLRRLLAALPLMLALAGLAGITSPVALAGGSFCSAKVVGNSLLHTDVQSAVDAASSGATIEVRGTCFGPVIIGKNLTLVGKSTPDVSQPGIYGQESVRVLEVQAGATVTVRKLELAYGLVGGKGVSRWGGGILNHGTLRLTNVVVHENDAEWGGGIANFGTLTLDGATAIHHNRASYGAGIYTEGSLTLRGKAAVYLNTGISAGGGIAASYNSGPVPTVAMHDHSVVRKNSADNGAGIDGWRVKLLLDGAASVRNNTAADHGGGINLRFGRLTLAGSATIKANGAEYGGGVATQAGSHPPIVLKGSSVISGNTASGAVAGILTDGNLTMSGSASVRDHLNATDSVILVIGTTGFRPVFTMKAASRVTHNTMSGSLAAVQRACDLLPKFVGLKTRVKGNTPANIGTALC